MHNHTLLFHRISRTYSSVIVAVNANDVGLRGATATLRARRRLRKHAAVFRLRLFADVSIPTLSAVTRVESVLLRPGPHADAKQPGQDDKREEHGSESQGDLL